MMNLSTRRDWLVRNAAAFVAISSRVRPCRPGVMSDGTMAARIATHAEQVELGLPQGLAQRALDAARAVGASYADVRLTRTVGHAYRWDQGVTRFDMEAEVTGVGVRAVIDGYWGFAASAFWTPDEVVRLARDAVVQAKTNAALSMNGSPIGTLRRVEMGQVPAVTGMWTTPISIDPFKVSIEEKLDTINYWKIVATENHLEFKRPLNSYLLFMRQERVVATSDGTLVTQTLYETGGELIVGRNDVNENHNLHMFDFMGRGWELIVDAKVPEQLATFRAKLAAETVRGSKPATVGRYTVVCDGATMAAVLSSTLGRATQLDVALGYEANAGGTSFIDDPLAMVGQSKVASPFVTVTANRSAPMQLATVRWDDEGVVPEPFPLVKDGVLVDFQTTREQAAWLAPYYQQHGRPIQSHGCARSEDALVTTLQMTPNLALEPSSSKIQLEDLVATVREGILLEQGWTIVDFQGRGGLIDGKKTEIKNGRLGKPLDGGAVLFNTQDLWTHIEALGGAATTQVIAKADHAFLVGGHGGGQQDKGEPAQATNFSVQAVAATILNQPLIDPSRKA
jgi:TldD protein